MYGGHEKERERERERREREREKSDESRINLGREIYAGARFLNSSHRQPRRLRAST